MNYGVTAAAVVSAFPALVLAADAETAAPAAAPAANCYSDAGLSPSVNLLSPLSLPLFLLSLTGTHSLARRQSLIQSEELQGKHGAGAGDSSGERLPERTTARLPPSD